VNDVAVDAAGNIFVVGYSQTMSGSNVPQDPVVVKFTSAGIQDAFYGLTGDSQDEALRVVIDQNSQVYVVYRRDNDGGIPFSNTYDILLERYDNNLVPNGFSQTYNNPNINQDDTPSDLAIAPSGDIFMTGVTENDSLGGHINQNWITLGYDRSGAQIFISNFEGPNYTDDVPHALTIRGPHLWVCGYTEGVANNQRDLTINNYDLTFVGLDKVAESGSAIAYPNPFSDRCRIYLTEQLSANATLQLFDMLGKEVSLGYRVEGDVIALQRGNLPAGIYQFTIHDGTAVVSGGRLVIQ